MKMHEQIAGVIGFAIILSNTWFAIFVVMPAILTTGILP